MLDALDWPGEADPGIATPDPDWHALLEHDMRRQFAEAGLLGSYAVLNRALGWP